MPIQTFCKAYTPTSHTCYSLMGNCIGGSEMRGNGMMFLRVGKFMFSSTKTDVPNGTVERDCLLPVALHRYHLPPSKTHLRRLQPIVKSLIVCRYGNTEKQEYDYPQVRSMFDHTQYRRSPTYRQRQSANQDTIDQTVGCRVEDCDEAHSRRREATLGLSARGAAVGSCGRSADTRRPPTDSYARRRVQQPEPAGAVDPPAGCAECAGAASLAVERL